MDVQPPHQSIHTWRDFFIHLITITIGLLIALSLEATAEWLHHRHLVHIARASIRHEMEENRKILASDLSSVQQDQARIGNDIKLLVALRSGTKFEHASLEYHIDWSSLSDAAWHTAQSTGALNFMDYESARALSDVYSQVHFVSDRGLILFDEQSRAISPVLITSDPNLMLKDEIQIVLLRSADVFSELRGLEQLLKELDEQLATQLRNDDAAHQPARSG
jgi:hypothetical protein